MRFTLKRTVEPTLEPVRLEEALVQCHADSGVEDEWFTHKIKSGRIKTEEYLRRSLVTQTWEMTLDGFSDTIYLPRSPIQSVESIKYYGTDNTEYTLDQDDVIIDLESEPGRIKLAFGKSWPSVVLREINSVKIAFVAGYGDSADDVPVTIKDAILLYVSHAYNNWEGETRVPDAFFDLLRPIRVYV